MDLFDEVKKDLDARNELGWKQHNRPMRPHDGRNSLRDAYEEALDLVMYLKKAILEADGYNPLPSNGHAGTSRCVR